MKRPIIAITLFYITLIAFFEFFGVFGRIPAQDIARNAVGQQDTIAGKIINDPEESRDKITFVLKAQVLNGSPAKGNIIVNVYDENTPVSYGDIVEITGKFFRPAPAENPGTFDYGQYLSRKKIYSIMSVYSSGNVKVLDSQPSKLWQFAISARKGMLETYRRYLLPERSAVLAGITIGEKSGLTDRIKKIFVDAGIMHVLVVSGSNVAFVAVIFLWVFRKIFRIKRKISLIILVPIILLYAALTGANPPVVRATIMALVVVISLLISRHSDVYQGLFFAAFIILIYNPLTLFEAGFQMSFVATLGIVYFFPKFQSLSFVQKTPKIVQWILSVFFASLSAQIAIFPLLAYYFNKVSVIAIISNLFILPLVAVLLGAGFLLYFISLTGTFLVIPMARITDFLVLVVTKLADTFASVPYAIVRVPTPPIYVIAIFYIIIFGLPKFRNYVWKRVLLISFIGLFLSLAYRRSPFRSDMLNITFLSVGLGDAVYFEFPNGKNMLMDGGGNWNYKYDIGETVISAFLWNKGVYKIDTVVLTHPHFNHYQGLLSVMENFQIKKFIKTEENSDEEEFERLMAIAQRKNIPVSEVSDGDILAFGDVALRVINPNKITGDSDRNSLVFYLEYDDFSALFCGDIPRIIQNKLTEDYIYSKLLLVPSHGKKRLLEDFIDVVSPEYAVISTDKPSRVVMEQFSDIKVYSTNVSGAIRFETDGQVIKISETNAGAHFDMIVPDYN
ncbi:MAG: ComEC family competence protein [Elusimicrobia bacterium ADurb.Bin231]|nr:MAG: ComEC family competence protein [Elusimicrobia bacterium ADurb.Bin231]